MSLPEPDDKRGGAADCGSSAIKPGMTQPMAGAEENEAAPSDLAQLRILFDEIGQELTRTSQGLEKAFAAHPWLVASGSFFLGIAVARLFNRGDS